MKTKVDISLLAGIKEVNELRNNIKESYKKRYSVIFSNVQFVSWKFKKKREKTSTAVMGHSSGIKYSAAESPYGLNVFSSELLSKIPLIHNEMN